MTTSATPVLEATDASVGYDGNVLLTPFSVTIHAGDQIAIVGRSGSGKTTLLMVLAGLIPPATGSVIRHDTTVASIPQAPSLIADLSALENCELPLRLHSDTSPDEAVRRARGALADVGISTPDALPGELSGGQQHRVAIARALASDARVVFADEPTAALDGASADRVMTALRRHCADVNGALVIATHDEAVADALAIRWRIEDGRLQGTQR